MLILGSALAIISIATLLNVSIRTAHDIFVKMPHEKQMAARKMALEERNQKVKMDASNQHFEAMQKQLKDQKDEMMAIRDDNRSWQREQKLLDSMGNNESLEIMPAMINALNNLGQQTEKKYSGPYLLHDIMKV